MKPNSKITTDAVRVHNHNEPAMPKTSPTGSLRIKTRTKTAGVEDNHSETQRHLGIKMRTNVGLILCVALGAISSYARRTEMKTKTNVKAAP